MALNCIDYNCDDDTLGTFTENTCGVEFTGNQNQAVIFGCNATTTDFTDGAQILADIAADLAWLITGAKFTINKATPTKLESEVPCRPSRVTTYVRTGDYYNPNVSSVNDDVHDILFSGKSFGAILMYECSSNDDGYPQSKLINNQVNFDGSLVSIKGETQRYEGTINWVGMSNPKTIVTPTGVFVE